MSQENLTTPDIDSDLTTMPVATPLTDYDDTAATRDHIEVAPLIDFEARDNPSVTDSLRYNGDVIDLTSSPQSSSRHSLPNGDTPVLDLPNDISGGRGTRGKAASELSQSGDTGRGGEGRGGEGDEMEEDAATESIVGSQQELF